jgi:hypothetical protein
VPTLTLPALLDLLGASATTADVLFDGYAYGFLPMTGVDGR